MINQARTLKNIKILDQIIAYMKKHDVTISPIHYDHVINVYVDNNDIENAMKYITEVKEANIEVHDELQYTINRIIKISELSQSEQTEIITQSTKNAHTLYLVRSSKEESSKREMVITILFSILPLRFFMFILHLPFSTCFRFCFCFCPLYFTVLISFHRCAVAFLFLVFLAVPVLGHCSDIKYVPIDISCKTIFSYIM